MKELLDFIDYLRAKINVDCEICIFSKNSNEIELQASFLKKGLMYKTNIIVLRSEISLSKYNANIVIDNFCKNFNRAIYQDPDL